MRQFLYGRNLLAHQHGDDGDAIANGKIEMMSNDPELETVPR